MARENFYRRDPGLALQGMSSMNLEERGVYNTVIDLLYLTWRPLEDDRGYIAGHCRCAVQKLNPILNRLIAAGKLVTFIEDGRTYISNPTFERERAAVKGPAKTRSGRAHVGQKSGEVGEKSDGVEKNPPLLDSDVEQDQPDAPLDKSRVEETRQSPQPPKGAEEKQFALLPGEPPPADEVRLAFDAWNELAARCGLPKAEDLTDKRRRAIKARIAGGGVARWRRALAAVEASGFCLGQKPPRKPGDAPFRADIDFVCQASSFQRLIEGYYGTDAKPVLVAVPTSLIDANDGWRRRVNALVNGSKFWNPTDWGPEPGRPGCRVPAQVQREFGFTPAQPEGAAA